MTFTNVAVNPRHFINAAVWEQERSIIEAFELLENSGFKCFDIGTVERSEAETLACYMTQNGLTVVQSHMPFNRYKREDYAAFADKVMLCAENAKILGSNILVVHGDEFDFEAQEYTPEVALEFNYRFFSPIVDFAEKNDMKVAFENVFNDWWPENRPRFCSKTEELCALVDKFSTDTVGICWDSGHGKVEHKSKHVNELKKAGGRVIATHIHDNYYGKDLHLFPFFGDTDWPSFMSALKEMGYKGDLTFEIGYNRIPKELAPDYLRLLYRSGEYLISL